MAEELLRRNIERAFSPPPSFPESRLVSRTMAIVASPAAQAGTSAAKPGRWAGSLGTRTAHALAVILVLVVVGAAAGVYVALHRPDGQVTPSHGPIIFPTKMVSATAGWAVTDRGGKPPLLWRTTDGGATWTEASPPSLADRVINADANFFMDSTHAWVTETGGGQPGSPTFHVVTFRTVDGGKTWQRGAEVAGPLISALPQQFFLDSDHGWLVMSGQDLAHPSWPAVYASADGGLHWSLVAENAGAGTPTGDLSPSWGAASFSTPSTGWLVVALTRPIPNGVMVAHAIVLVTRDGGRSWRAQALPVQPGDVSAFDPPVFFDRSTGVMFLHSLATQNPAPSVLLRPTDGGLTWSARQLACQFVSSVQFVDAKHGWAVAGPGSDFAKGPGARTIALPLYRTDDGGATWTKVTTNLNLEASGKRLTDLHFVDAQTGFATIWGDTGPSAYYRSRDGGRTWFEVRVC